MAAFTTSAIHRTRRKRGSGRADALHPDSQQPLTGFSSMEISGRHWKPYTCYRVNTEGIRMKIGELAAATGCDVQTVRYYEREGLLAEPHRTASNYRSYGPGHVERLLFIRRCRSLDMTLDEIRALLRFVDAPEENCGEVNRVIDEHLRHVESRLAELEALQQRLRALRRQCRKVQAAAHCGILNELAVGGPVPRPKRKATC
jgi:Cd(II)/Pb(II)-responsive transcriptional regulator